MMKFLLVIISSLLLFSCVKKSEITVSSPDGKAEVYITIDDSSHVSYSVYFKDTALIQNSKLGFQPENEPVLGKNVEIISSEETTVNLNWKPVYGERSEVKDHYNQLKIRFRETISRSQEFEMTFRVYNEGVAFNYTFLPQPGKNKITLEKELTEFRLTGNYPAWISDRAQSEYRKVPVNEIGQPAERPLVIEAGSTFLALGEAKLIDFSRMKLRTGERENSLVASLHDAPTVELPYTTPWRTIMIGRSPDELLENNCFYENLNDPCAIEDVSWIKPGKVIREVTLTTQGGLACVDFAAENGLQYVEFDAGWYGSEGDESSDATTVTVDPARSPGPLDLHHVIEYAESKGIGIIVYVNRRALEKQIDEILPLYKSWGIKGVKYGFVQVGSQEWTAWLHEAVKKAAQNQLMVDIHDEYRTTGFSRTYPNLMTQEGIRGDEESPSNEHTLITLFTRMLAGAGDNTICYFAPRVTEKMGGHISQLAKAVMLYSPWQFLYWYDRPQDSPGRTGGAGSSEGYIQNVPELEFFKNMPTVWDETKVIEGKIREYATIARKSGSDWFLGSLTGNSGKTVRLNLDFLDENVSYEAVIYSHDPGSKSPTNVKIEKQEVNAGSVLEFEVAESSGLAVQFRRI
jgi:alpha-glucosidase